MWLRPLIAVIGLGMFVGAIFYANRGTLESENLFMNWVFAPGVVTEILEDNTFYFDDNPHELVGHLRYEVRLRNGEYREATFHIIRVGQEIFEIGDRVVVRYHEMDGVAAQGEIYNRDRSAILVGMVILFLLVLVILGGKSGIKTVGSLIFTMASLIFLLNPLLLRGYPAILTTLVILSIVSVTVLVFISGFTKKTAVAALSCIIGVFCAALIAHLAGIFAGINGFNTENIGFIVHASENNGITVDAAGFFISGVLIASLGAVMDTAVSIASGTQEIKAANPSLSRSQLFKASYNIGKDVMGTMANTLILAFAGSALNLILTMSALQISFTQMINNDFLGVEIIRSLGGSLGIAFTVPAAAIIGSWLFDKGN